MAPTQKKVPALRLTLGGAPNTPHMVEGLPGFYWPDQPMPVGGDGEISVEEAQKAHDDPGCHLELVELTQAEAKKAREVQAQHRGPAIRAARELAAEAAGEAEIEQARDTLDAALGQTPDEAAGESGQEG